MSNVVSLMDILPVRVRDVRLVALQARYGTTNTFSAFDAAEVLGIPPGKVWELMFCKTLSDDVVRVNVENGAFRLHPVPPLKAALMTWRDRYLPIMRALPQPFGAHQFATAASIPYPTANYLLATFLQHDIVKQSFTGDSALWRAPPRRRVIMAATERPRRVIYVGY